MVDSVRPWRGTDLRYDGNDLHTIAVAGRTAVVGRFSVSAGPKDEVGFVVSAVDVENMRASRGAVLDLEPGLRVTVTGRYIIAPVDSSRRLVVLRNPFA